MYTPVDTTAYLNSLSSLAMRGFITSQAATQAVLELMTEQLNMCSSFLTQIIREDGQEIVLAVHNEPGGCDIKAGTTVSSLSFSNGCCLSVPVVLSNGTIFGKLCAADVQQQELNPLQIKLLVVLARLLATQFERDKELRGRKWVETELAQALTSLQYVNEQQEQMNKLQRDFFSVMNHEFRTALTGIQGFSELLRDADCSFEEIKEYASDINADAKRLSSMLGEVLDLERMKLEKFHFTLPLLSTLKEDNNG